jgi:hypothetical protein
MQQGGGFWTPGYAEFNIPGNTRPGAMNGLGLVGPGQQVSGFWTPGYAEFEIKGPLETMNRLQGPGSLGNSDKSMLHYVGNVAGLESAL